MRQLITWIVAVWVIGIIFGEAIQQVAAGCAVALALVQFVRRRPELDIRLYAWSSAALAFWQLTSPVVARATGVVTTWPPGLRYGQVLDTLAGAALAIAGTIGIPWEVVATLLAGGWCAATLLGIVQHYVRWDWTPFGLFKNALTRMQENFGSAEKPRFAAGGFYLHRLRLAHGAIACLGPALSYAANGKRGRFVAALVAGALFGLIYLSYARAALLASFVMGLVAMILWLRGRILWGAAALTLLVVIAAGLSPVWQRRFRDGVDNLSNDGERALAMRTGLTLGREHPWLGVGFGNHRAAALAITAPTQVNERLAIDSHNLWLTVWVETGALGLVLMLGMHGTLVWGLLKRARQGSFAAKGALVSFGGFLLLSLVHYLPYHTSVYLTFSFVWGLGLCDGSEVLLGRRAGVKASGEPC